MTKLLIVAPDRLKCWLGELYFAVGCRQLRIGKGIVQGQVHRFKLKLCKLTQLN